MAETKSENGSSKTVSARRNSSGEGSETSPSRVRSPPARYEPIVTDAQSSDGDTFDGERRPDQPRGRRSQVHSPDAYGYGSITSDYDQSNPSATGEQRHASADPDRQHPSRINSRASSIRHHPTSERQEKSKRPGVSRRVTSSAGPHRGQEFSVDDDMTEVEEHYANRHGLNASSVSGRGSLRRKSSTLRRRGTTPAMPRLDSSNEDEETPHDMSASMTAEDTGPDETSADAAIPPEAIETIEGSDDGSELSDAESFTLRDRQNAINETHPFGIRLWKPALYKKNRSVQTTAEGDIHSSPGGRVSLWLLFFNILWTILFGWWLAIASISGAAVCFLFAFEPSSVEYARVLWDLGGYLFYPFGKSVKLEQDEAYAAEDRGEGRSISEYEQWQSGDLEDGRLFFGPLTSRSLIGRRRNSVESADENDSLLGRTRRDGGDSPSGQKNKRRLFGRGQWTAGRVIFFVFFYGLISPLLLLVSAICWLLVFWIPMGKVTLLLFDHLRRHPLALSFHAEGISRRPGSPTPSSILVCTYRAVGMKYWKYTIDGTNIFFINLMGVVLFVIFDYWVLKVWLGLNFGLTHPAFIFTFSLFSIIPLAYFIGQAVASISAQSSMGLGAAINAFFSTIVEVFLYCVALNQGKRNLVEGSIIGSIFAGILFLPGISMCFGAIKRKTQKFNARSAGVTSTMLLFAVIAAFGPTLFYQIYGTHELNCLSCIDTHDDNTSRDCRRCYFSQVPAITDRFFIEAVQPYCWFAAVLLFTSYVIGLWFTLRTHAAVIWASEADEKKAQVVGPSPNSSTHPEHRGFGTSGANATLASQNAAANADASRRASVRDSPLYRRILNQSVRSGTSSGRLNITSAPQSPHMVPPRSSDGDAHQSEDTGSSRISGLSEADNRALYKDVAEMAATAATVGAITAVKAPRKTSVAASFSHSLNAARTTPHRANTFAEEHEEGPDGIAASGGHDAPNWSRKKSSIVLMGATVLYAIIAEILVDTVDIVLESVEIDEKFLGMTLFALVPNTTEFLNAISFAMNGNIALSMEIGSAYALQVCLLQVPALVFYSAIRGRWLAPADLIDHTFTLIFPQWDMVTVILCVFLLSYMYGEGKSNYFKGSILILSYLVVMMGFYLSGDTDVAGASGAGMRRFDMLSGGQVETFKTVGRGKSGRAW